MAQVTSQAAVFISKSARVYLQELLSARQLPFHTLLFPDIADAFCDVSLSCTPSCRVWRCRHPSFSAGSGVLAIAALKMGGAQAYGTDTDPLAVRAAAQNAALNGMAERFQAVQCGGSAEGPEPLAALACRAPSQSGAFDVIIANILQVWTASSPHP